jgi:hypothetical protein
VPTVTIPVPVGPTHALADPQSMYHHETATWGSAALEVQALTAPIANQPPGAPFHNLDVLHSNDGPPAPMEQQNHVFEQSSASVTEESSPATNLTDSNVDSESQAEMSEQSQEDNKSLLTLLNPNRRTAMRKTRRKAPPASLSLAVNNRSSSYTASHPNSPGVAMDIRRASSATNFRIQKSNRYGNGNGPRSPIRMPSTAHQFPVHHLFPQTPLLSPGLVSSSAERFPDYPSSASDEFGLRSSTSSYSVHPGFGMNSPPITPFTPIHVSNQPNATHWTPPQSAPATQTTFSTAVGAPLLTPTFETATEPNTERRPSLPANHYLPASHDAMLGLTVPMHQQQPDMVPTTNDGNMMMQHGMISTTSGVIADPVMASNGNFAPDFSVASDETVTPANVRRSDSMPTTDLVTSISNGFDFTQMTSNNDQLSTEVNEFELLTMPNENSVPPQLLNPFTQPFSMSMATSMPNVTSHGPAMSNEQDHQGLPTSGSSMYHFVPQTLDAAGQPIQMPEAQGATGFRWHHASPRDYESK